MYIWCQGNQSELKKSFYCFHSVQEVKEMSSHLTEATKVGLLHGPTTSRDIRDIRGILMRI